MKQNIYKYLLLLAMFSIVSCSDELDLLPSQSLDENIALTTDKNVKTVLNGAYDALSNENFLGGNVLRNAELQGGDDEVNWVGTFVGPREIFNKQMTATNSDAQECWLAGYNAINIANNVLSALDVVNKDDVASVEGEARFIRALSYFELVRIYAQPFETGGANSQLGIPIVLLPTRQLGDEQKVPRSTVAQVYDQILSDLKKSAELLPSENEWRANSVAATGLLARVFLQMGDHVQARDAADKAISSEAYSLLDDYGSLFGRGENSSEDMFAIQVSSQDGVNNMCTFFSIPEFGGRDGDIEILQGHLDLYDANDARFKLFYDGNGATRSGKWNNQYGIIGLMRLAEMHLIRAECNAILGTTIGASPVEDYNLVHTRAGLDAVSTVSLSEILTERRRELAHEGFIIHDLKRIKKDVGPKKYNDPKLIFPIPLREIEANSNLVQNEGY